jgi:hypothetical protein
MEHSDRAINGQIEPGPLWHNYTMMSTMERDCLFGMGGWVVRRWSCVVGRASVIRKKI